MRKETILKPLQRKLEIRKAQLADATRKKQLASGILARHKAEVEEAEALGRYEEIKTMMEEIKNI